jgi:hypothetical protein
MAQPFEKNVIEEGYEAFVTVKRRRVTKTANGNGYFDDPAEQSERVLLDIKLTGGSLDSIALKIKQHTDLVEDE